MRRRVAGGVAAALSLWSTFAAAGTDGATAAVLSSRLRELLGPDCGAVRYLSRAIDLDDDGSEERIVYAIGPGVCGTGGCGTFVFAGGDGGLRLVANIALTRPPITAADTRTNGWRDLVVHVAGGGILPGYDALLRFDGTTYPTNPTVEPAEPVAGEVSGIRILEDLAESSRWRRLDDQGR